LIIEDEMLVAKSIAHRLRKMGYEVIDTLSSGKQAVRTVQRMRPDVVLMDIQLPGGLDGVETAARIRSRYDVPIIYLTAHVNDEILERAKITSPCGYLLKPFQERELRVTLEMALYRQRVETRYRQLFNALMNGVVVYEAVDEGEDFLFRDFNRAAERIEGVQREDVIGQRVTEVFPGVVDFGLLEVMRRVWRSGEPEHVPATLYEDEHRSGWRESYVYRLPTGEVVAVYSDVTAHIRTEQALRRERDMLERLMETSPVGITVVDRQGRIVFANARAEAMFGLTRDEITERTYNAPAWRITDYDGNPMPDEALPFQRVMASSEAVYDVRHAIQWPDGRRMLLSINGAPLYDEQDQVDGVVFVIQDVTEQVREEERRRRQLDQEFSSLDALSVQRSSATARSFGVVPMRQGVPQMFAGLADQYAALIDEALEQRAYKVDYPTSDALQDLARRLGTLRAGPRDVVDLHSAVLREKTEAVNPVKAQAYVEEGRFLALELMGYLAAYYRNFASDVRGRGALSGTAAPDSVKGDADDA
jgi:PAS domain S-box-containing protein